MQTVYKYPMMLGGESFVSMPVGAEVLFVGEQHGQIALWAKIETMAQPTMRKFIVVGTGHEIAAHYQELSAVGTVLMMGGSLVLHVFEVL